MIGPDVRALYADALQWVVELMDAVPSGMLSRPTPCPAFSVRELMGHLVGTAQRGLATAQRQDVAAIPHVITGIPDERMPARYRALARRLHEAWDGVDLAGTVSAPWAETTAEEALWGFSTETVVHGWDLAVATEQPTQAPVAVVRPLLSRASVTLPATSRKKSYAAPVLSRPDSGVTEQLANWLGHRRCPQ